MKGNKMLIKCRCAKNPMNIMLNPRYSFGRNAFDLDFLKLIRRGRCSICKSKLDLQLSASESSRLKILIARFGSRKRKEVFKW